MSETAVPVCSMDKIIVLEGTGCFNVKLADEAKSARGSAVGVTLMEPVPVIKTARKVLILWLNVNRDTSVNKGVGSELKNWGSVSGTGTDFPTHCARTGLETAK